VSARAFTESTVEDTALGSLETIGWQVAHGPDVTPEVAAVERQAVRWGDLGPWDRLDVFVKFEPAGTGR
jgi:hypothetical protein